MSKKIDIILILAVATGARLINLAGPVFWYDEAFTGLLSRGSLADLFLAAAGDTHPPLYYLVTWTIYHLGGSSEFWLRFISVVFSVLALWMVWRISNRLHFTRTMALVTVGILAVLPTQLHYSQEARMYAMFQFLCLGCFDAVLNRRYFEAGIYATAAAYTHYYAGFYLLICFLVGFTIEFTKHPANPAPNADPNHGAKIAAVVKAFAIPATLFLPWQFVLYNQMVTVNSGYWIQPVTFGGVLYSILMQFVGFTIPPTWQIASLFVIFLLVIMGIVRGLKPERWLLLLWSMGPIVLAVVVSLVWAPVYLFRGLFPSSPGFIMLIVAAVAELKIPRFQKVALTTTSGLILAALVFFFYRDLPVEKGPGRIQPAIDQIRSEMQPGDQIYHANDGSAVMWSWLAPDLDQRLIPQCAAVKGGLTNQTRRGLGIRYAGQAPDTIYLVWFANMLSPECEIEGMTELTNHGELLTTIEQSELISATTWRMENAAGLQVTD